MWLGFFLSWSFLTKGEDEKGYECYSGWAIRKQIKECVAEQLCMDNISNIGLNESNDSSISDSSGRVYTNIPVIAVKFQVPLINSRNRLFKEAPIAETISSITN